jgi:hypothetical protein
MSGQEAAAAAATSEQNLQKDPVTGEMISKSYVIVIISFKSTVLTVVKRHVNAF